MARDHARLLFSLWSDNDFKALGRAEQHLYMLILSQSTVSQAGVLDLSVRRWSTLADDTTVDDIRTSLTKLVAARFVLVDEDTEEVLIRSFIRNDGVLKNPYVTVAAVKDYRQILSPVLRRAWLAELRRLNDERVAGDREAKAWANPLSGPLLAGVLAEPLPEPPPDGHGEPFPERVQETHEPPSDPLPEGVPDPLSDPPSQGGTEPLSEGGCLRVRASRAALPPSPSLSITPHSVEGRDAPATDDDPTIEEDTAMATAQTLLGEWLDHCAKRPPKNVVGQVARQLKALLGEGIDADDVRRGLAAWHAKGQHPSTLPSFVNAAMNARPELRVVNGSASSLPPSRNAQILAAAMERARAAEAGGGGFA